MIRFFGALIVSWFLELHGSSETECLASQPYSWQQVHILHSNPLPQQGQHKNKHFETAPLCWLNFHLEFPDERIICKWCPISPQYLPVCPPNIILKIPPLWTAFLHSPAVRLCCWCVTCHAWFIQSWAGLDAGLTDHKWPSPIEAFGQRRATEALSLCCLSWHGSSENREWPGGGETVKRRLSSPNCDWLIVKGETCGERSGSAALWQPASPRYSSRWCPVNTTHTSGDNMAATDRNLLLEQRIKATEPDRNLLSDIHTLLNSHSWCKQKNIGTHTFILESVDYCLCSFTPTEDSCDYVFAFEHSLMLSSCKDEVSAIQHNNKMLICASN